MQNKPKILTLALAVISLCSCNNLWGTSSEKDRQQELKNTFYSATIEKPSYPSIRTPEGTNKLDLEVPLRCFVNWTNQQMISTIPYNLKAFNLVRNGTNDLLPKFEVNGFSFDTMSAEKALHKLTKEADIKLVAKDAPYASISAENLSGEFTDVINLICESAEVFYSYNANSKTLRITRKANFSLYIPRSRTILLAILDVLRGAGITDFTADFDDYTITFNADFELKNKIMNLINYFEENPILIAFDVRVFTIYPNNNKDIEWQEMLRTFDLGSVKSSKSGVLGKILTTSNDINIASLNSFVGTQAKIIPVAEGKFVVPNLWFSRFDIGKCALPESFDNRLSILAKSSFEQNNKIFTEISLESKNGEITQFNIRGKLGENILIIGIPNEIFGIKGKKSETIVFMVPRIIKTLKTNKHLKNNL